MKILLLALLLTVSMSAEAATDDSEIYIVKTSVWGFSDSPRPNIKVIFDDFQQIERIWPITESYHCRIYVAGHAPAHEESYFYDYNSEKWMGDRDEPYNACFINGGIFLVDEYYVMQIYFKRDGELHTATKPFTFVVKSNHDEEANLTKVIYQEQENS